MTARCDFSDLPAEQCACSACRPDLTPKPPKLAADSKPFASRWGARCAACDEWIPVGETVAYSDDQIIHWACAA